MSFKIPLFDLNFGRKEESAVLDTLRSKWISTGPKTHEFEKKFSSMLGAKHAVAVANCTAALHLAMKILGIKRGDHVICPSLTFVATVNAIRYVNAIPIFCDIVSYEDLTVSPEMIKTLITPKTKAIIVMHYGGFPCDMDKIIQISKKNGLKVLEDAAHSPLSEYKGKKLGTIGDVGCFSFFSNKNISTGEGGMIVTNNTEIADKARLMRSHGMTSMSYERSRGHATNYDVVELGYNFRMDDIRAALGIAQLDKLEKDIGKRADIRKYYIDKLSKIEGIIIPFRSNHNIVSNYIFPIVLKESDNKKRDVVRDKLMEAGIQTSVHYPAVHRFSIYKRYKADLPKTEYVSDNLITLPMYSSLKKSDIEMIYLCLKNQ